MHFSSYSRLMILCLLAIVGATTGFGIFHLYFQDVSDRSEEFLVFYTTTYDLGDLSSNTEARAIFSFHNASRYFVQLMEVVPSCGCISVDHTDRIIPPDGHGTIELLVSTRGLVPPVRLRKRPRVKYQKVDIQQHAQEVYERELEVVGVVRPDVVAVPSELRIPSSYTKEVSLDLCIKREMASNAQFKSIRLHAPSFVTINKKEDAKDATQMVYHLTINAAHVTTINPPIEVCFGDDFYRDRISIPITAIHEKSDIVLRPDNILMVVSAGIKPSELKKQSIKSFQIVAENSADVTIENVVTDSPFLCWEPDNNRADFITLWLNDVPKERLSVHKLFVNCSSGKNNSTVRLPLVVHLFLKDLNIKIKQKNELDNQIFRW